MPEVRNLERKKCWSKENIRAAVVERRGIKWRVGRLGLKDEDCVKEVIVSAVRYAC